MTRTRTLLTTLAVVASVTLQADEGMWTFDHPPTQQVQQRYGFAITQPWLDHLRLSSVRFPEGSGSFVSPNGLVLTNHHVALEQLEKISTPQKNYVADGFYARTRADELKSADAELDVLTSTEDVTARVTGAAEKASSPEAALEARKAEIARIQKECVDATKLRCDSVTLYQGAQYWLYRYKKYTDVRLVFAPEQQMAFFGGDPDNFTYPRYDLDFAIFRVYENGQPVHSENYLKWNAHGAADQELVFVTGHPGSTDRDDTVAELETDRDVIYPINLQVVRRRIAALRKYAAQGAEQARQANGLIFALENALKAYTGEYDGLKDPAIMAKKTADENALRARVGASPDLQAKYGGAWAAIARAEQIHRRQYKTERFAQLRGSSLAPLGLLLVQYAEETGKPDPDRLDGFHDAQLPTLKFELSSPAPYYPALETALLADSLQESREELGANDPFVKATLGSRTSDQAAAALIGGTKLGNQAYRKMLLDGGAAAINASSDPLIVLGRALDPLARAAQKLRDRDVTSVISAARRQVGQARFAVSGTAVYPDATFTLRLSYGTVDGYPMNGTKAPYKTTFYGLYGRSADFDDKPPFQLTPRFNAKRAQVNMTTPLDFVTTNDIIGGNSGSPVVNRAGELVGLIFDGNIESLVGRFVYDGARNRSVAVHAGAIVHALRTIYEAGPLADELEGQ
ncbi:MAG TPA: S46 family peptidase [Vicinamibacterales bacterium]|nr:S46 family peptidase [Vicinamibacterales bacterium]